jgi:hypothetical protein
MSATSSFATDALFEGFEDAQTLPTDWSLETSDATCKATFSVDSYSNLADFKNSRIPVLDELGSKCLVAFTGGYSTMGKVIPDMKLTTATFTVPDNGVATFYYSYNLAYNNASGMAEEDKTILEVAAIADGAEANLLFSDVSAGLGKWRKVCVDLSQYAGQTIALRFRNYNNSMSEALGSLLSQRLYIDNLTVNSEASSDLCIMAVGAFTSGALSQQPAVVTVRNYGLPVDSYTVSYQIGENEAVTETVNQALAANETYSYTFTQPAQFANGGSQTVAFKVVADADDFLSNNESSATANIFPLGELPYDSAEGSLSTDFTSTFSGTSRVVGGWKYYSNLSSWVYTGSAYKAYLYSNSAYTLGEGNYTVSFDYTSTSATATAELYLFKSVDNYLEPVATRLLSQEVEDVQTASLTFNVAEAGDYLFGLSVADIASMEQVAATNIKLQEAAPTADVAVVEVVTPQSNVAAGTYGVTVKVANVGGVTAENVAMQYQFDDQEAVSATIASLAAGDELLFTFPTKLVVDKEPGEYTLTVTATVEGDENAENNSAEQTIAVYAPLSLPWSETFTDDENIDRWTVVNPDNDSSYWGVTDEYTWGSCNVMLLNAFNTTVHNDWLISPAINFDEAKVRLSFYYGALSVADPASHLKVYLAKSTDVEDILANGQLIKDVTMESASLKYFSEVVEPVETGTYYVAILGCEGVESLYVTDVRLNTNSELYVTSASLSEAKPVCDVPVTVTVHLVNSGFTDMNDVQVSYSAQADNIDCEPIEAEETIASLPANSEMDYTFVTPLSFPQYDTYTTVISVDHDADADARNNTLSITSETQYVKLLPYTMGFESATGELVLNGKWDVAGLSPYAGSNALSLIGKSTDQDNGDWAFLDKVYMPAGSYELSFFWRTFPGSTGANYHRAFSVCIGEAATADAMTTTLFNTDDALNATEFATKELVPVTIEQDGMYVIGIHCLAQKAQGRLTVDEFKLSAADEGIAVGKGAEAYEPDITEGWYHYHPVGAISQWTATSDNSAMEVSEYSDWSGSMKASYLAAPALKLEAENTYQVTFGYEAAAYEASDDASAFDATANKLELFAATQDLPSSYQLLASTDGVSGEITAIVQPETTANYYFAFRPNSTSDATYRLNSFKVEQVEASAISNLTKDATATFTVSGNTVIPNGQPLTIYNALGQRIATTSRPISLPSGLYIINHRKLAL